MTLLDTFEVAWAAGYFDGEGNVGYYTGKGDGSNGSVRLAIGNTQREELVRFQRAVLGLGTITGPTCLAGRKPIWKWQVQSFVGSQAVVAVLWRFLSSNKRDDARRALETAELLRQERLAQPFCSQGHTDDQRIVVKGRPRCRRCLSAHLR